MSSAHALNSFIGREAEIEHIAPLILTRRLVTLTGSGGAGKTRLALEVTERLRAEFDETCVVELAGLNDPELLPRVVAQTLGLVDPSDEALLERLTAFIQDHELLLVLDNCEHLIDACTGFVAALLSRCCANFHILATSREPLGVPGEIAWRVRPLSAPALGAPEVDLQTLVKFDAVRLFIDRAREADSEFTLSPADAPALAAVCTRLDGMPLAIELAAARIKVLTLAQIAARLEGALGLLGSGQRGAPHRHRTIRATIDWSYRLLDEPAAAVLCRLSVFSCGWALEAAAAVCPHLVGGPHELLDVMEQLVDKSLVVAAPDGAQMRYHLLEVLRQFAAEQLAGRRETESTCELHLAYYVALAEQAKPELRSPRLRAWLGRLDREYDNLRAALAFAFERAEGSERHAQAAVRLAIALEPYWRIRGYFVEGRAALGKAAAAARALATPAGVALLATALAAQANVAWFNPGPSPWQPLIDESIALWRSITSEGEGALAPQNRRGLAEALRILGMFRWAYGDNESARALFAESLALFGAVGDELGAADVLWNTGASWIGSDDALARQLNEQAVQIYQRQGDGLAAVRPRYQLAGLRFIAGDYNGARALYEQLLADARGLGNQHGISIAMLALGRVARVMGDMDSALKYHAEGVLVNRGIDLVVSDELLGLAHVKLAQGEPQEAAAYGWQGLELFRQNNDDLGVAAIIVWCAHFKRATGQPRVAVQLLAAVDAFCHRIGRDLYYYDRPERDHVLAQLRSEVRAPDFAAAWAEGLGLSLDDACRTGFGEPAARPAPPAPPLTPLRAARERFDGLTAREREIASCVAAGQTNREIAADLVLSERTVEAHIGNILSKLEFTSRTQIATWAVQKGLARPQEARRLIS